MKHSKRIDTHKDLRTISDYTYLFKDLCNSEKEKFTTIMKNTSNGLGVHSVYASPSYAKLNIETELITMLNKCDNIHSKKYSVLGHNCMSFSWGASFFHKDENGDMSMYLWYETKGNRVLIKW